MTIEGISSGVVRAARIAAMKNGNLVDVVRAQDMNHDSVVSMIGGCPSQRHQLASSISKYCRRDAIGSSTSSESGFDRSQAGLGTSDLS